MAENVYKTLMEIGGEGETCKFNRSRVAARVTGGAEISQNETQMAQWLLQNGPISVGLNANVMQFYRGDVSRPFKFMCDPSDVGHRVLIVGFREHDYPLFHKKLPLIKNSLGPGWGEQGYYRGDGSCSINTLTSSTIVE